MKITLIGDLITSISDHGRQLLGRRADRNAPVNADTLLDLAGKLLSRRGEASGIALSSAFLLGYQTLNAEEKIRFFKNLAQNFGPQREWLDIAIAAYTANPNQQSAQELHDAAEPLRQELFRRLNRAPGGTPALVSMRNDLLGLLRDHPDLEPVDHDFVHLLTSWFNRGFLVLRRIDWRTPANILEKIIAYEAVHAINDWDDLRRRTEPEDRRCFGFFHPALGDEPLIFVEVALTTNLPDAIAPLLAAGREVTPLNQATTAVFYSISNCQNGLKGVSFGNFLIKQVAEELKRDLPNLTHFATLSPAPTFARWLSKTRQEAPSALFDDAELATLSLLDDAKALSDPRNYSQLRPILARAAAFYYLDAKNEENRPPDPVARFHLGNGARLEKINPFGDLSLNGLRQSHGLMVNYLYDLAAIEQNHEAFADNGSIAHSAAVSRLKTPLRQSRSSG